MQSTSSVPSFPLLPPSEFRIYALLERQGRPLTISEIGSMLARLDPRFEQGYDGLEALLLRMIKKGYVAQEEPRGTGCKLYRSLLPYDLVLQHQIESFLDTLHLTSHDDLQRVGEVVQARLKSGPQS